MSDHQRPLASQAPLRPYAGETYYGLPPLKPGHWNWTVSGYIWLAGLGGAAQVLAAIAQYLDRAHFAGVIRTARLLASLGSTIGAVLLIVDLKTPRRWFNMLRILRPTSPMSFGSYILSAFGGLSMVTLLGELLRGRGRLGRAASRAADAAQVGAAVSGAGAATYTAALLSATSAPGWAATPRHMGALFGTAAMTSAAAALALGERIGGRAGTARVLERLAGLAALVNLSVEWSASRQRRAAGLSPPPATSKEALLKHGGLAVTAMSTIASLALGSRRRDSKAGALGSLGLITGTWLLRHAMLQQGLSSTTRPRSYFRWAQPQHTTEKRRMTDGYARTAAGRGGGTGI